MIDDTRQPLSQQYDASFVSQFAAISECKITRETCYTWAQNLKYLAYYDGSCGPLQDTDLPNEVTEGEKRRGQAAGQHDPSGLLTIFNEKGEKDSSLFLADEDACGLCRSCPKFPIHEKAKTFQLVQFGKHGKKDGHRTCRHYLAVSYCWPKDSQGMPLPCKSTYSVMMKDSSGTRITRSLRAPDEIIDRVVECAKALNIRLIWLDQECLPQDESKEHATGIQAMDMVYQQAHVSAGLVDRVNMTQAQLTAVAVALDGQTKSEALGDRQSLAQLVSGSPGQIAEDLLTFLDAFADDPFNSRAWILQEMLSAGRKAILLFKHEDGAYYPESCGILSLPQFKISGTFNILLRDVLRLISNSRDHLLSSQDARFGSPFSARAAQIMGKLRLFHPQPSDGLHWSSFIYLRGRSAFGSRKTCSAAVALTYLSTRNNNNVADRLAILANICEYETRLDILKVEKYCQSLATCTFALALMNGDLSLFMPEAYSCSQVSGHVCFSSGPGKAYKNCFWPDNTVKRPSWMIPFHQLVPSIDTDVFKASRSISRRNGNMYKVRDSCIVLPGYLWKVNRHIDLRPIQRCFKNAWDSLKLCQVKGYHELGGAGLGLELQGQVSQESVATNQRRPEQTRARAVEQEVPKGHDQALTEPQPGHSKSGIRNEDVAARVVLGHHINRDPKAQIAVSLLMCHVLAYLHYSLGETAAANSIWHSIRSDAARTEPSSIPSQKTTEPIELSDEVEDALAECGKLPDLWEAFRFDLDSDGSFRQFWMVERIMRDGYLWVGQYEKYEVPEMSGGNSADEEAQPATKEKKIVKSKILARQLTQQMLASTILATKSETAQTDSAVILNIGAIVDFASECNEKELTRQGEERRGRRVSVFDVDSPCEVLVPFDRELELLPRAHHRSMSICWVVQRVDGLERVADRSRPCPSGVQTSKSNTAVPEKQQEQSGEIDSGGVGANRPGGEKSLDERDTCATLRIVDRVRGAWECMYLPQQRYEIV